MGFEVDLSHPNRSDLQPDIQNAKCTFDFEERYFDYCMRLQKKFPEVSKFNTW